MPTISVDAAAKRIGICVGSVRKLIRDRILPATQLMYAALEDPGGRPRE